MQFKTGSVYEYDEVPQSAADEFQKSVADPETSAGAHWNRIKGQFPYRKVSEGKDNKTVDSNA